MLGVKEAEKVSGGCHFASMKQRGHLPFASVQAKTRGNPEVIPPAHVFLLALVHAVRREWHVKLGEAATVVSMAAPALINNWSTVPVDSYIVRVGKAPGSSAYDVHLATKDGVAELLANLAAEAAPDDGLGEIGGKVIETLAAKGLPLEEIIARAVRAETAAIRKRAEGQPQRVWTLWVPGVLSAVCERAQRAGVQLPPLSDLAAWWMSK